VGSVDTLDLEPGSQPLPDDPPSSPVRLLLYTLGAALVVLLGSLLVSTNTEAPTNFDATPAPLFSSTPAELQPIVLRDTCAVRTDHRNVLAASFWLNNILEEPVLITSLQGHPPLGGVRQDGPVLSGGTCRKPGKFNAKAVIDPLGSRLYTVHWKLPDTCPEPYPLQVRVTYQLAGEDLMKSDFVTVLVDLGGIGFVQCPKVVMTEFPEDL
jgi:hypothetical protein